MKGKARNPLLKFFEQGDHRQIHKWAHYFEIYDRYFAKFRGKDLSLMEFGVSHGGSLQMWRQYFGPEARIYGVDLDPRCLALEEEGIKIMIADQGNREMMEAIKLTVEPLDIVIDDGGHRMNQQICTFETMFSHLKEGGIYLAEDLHTSYWPEFGGGYRNPGSFIEYAKRLIDKLNSWHIRNNEEPHSDFSGSAYAMHFYDSVLVIEKRAMIQPVDRILGTLSLVD